MNSNTLPRRSGRNRAFRSLYLVPLLVWGGTAAAAAALPASLTPPAPFPLVTGAAVEREAVAPGVARATYRLLTSAGPLVVSVVAVDPREPTVRLGTVLARESIVSKGEPVSSMARRTGAVAGINGDYFDIGGSGAPVGILVRDGTLDRSPNGRVALTVTRDRTVRFETYRFSGAASSGAVSVPITAINEWPPQGGTALLTPAFGAVPAGPNGVTVVELQPMAPDASGARRFRVAAQVSAPPWPGPSSLRLAYGPAALGYGPVPDVGDVVTLGYETDPPLGNVAAALGGGPLLLQGGVPIDDPASPNYAERGRRIPAAAAARLADGTLALVVVDGRHPATSIGLDRAELIALLRGLGASDAMLFDSGGSATLVARVLGEAQAGVVNEPSDGVERPVADGLFVYSDAPLGPPARLVIRPAAIVALAGALVPLRSRIVDASGHALGDARGPWRIARTPLVASIGTDDVLRAGESPGAATVHVARGGVAADVPIDVLERVARLVIGPQRVNPEPRGVANLTVAAFDARDRPVAIDGLARWHAKDAAIDARGRLAAGEGDALVTVSVGGVVATASIPVGRHTAALTLFAEKRRPGWKLVTTPANGPATLAFDGDRLVLGYDFSAGGRAAYAVEETPLGEPLALSCAVDGDGNGAALRVTFVDRYGDREAVTLTRSIDFTGTRRLATRVPASLAPPIALRNFYVLGTLASPPLAASGAIGIHDCSASLAGSGNATGRGRAAAQAL